MEKKDLDKGIKEYTRHLRNVCADFNKAAKYINLPIKMDAAKQIRAIQSGFNLTKIGSFFYRSDDTGIVHETQLKTAIDCFWQLWTNSSRCGYILGAMQSGKTTTSLVLQWAGPVLYLLTGSRVHPFYLIGSQTSHEDQAKTELTQFLNYYGDIEIKITEGFEKYPPGTNALFARCPTLTIYRQEILKGILADVFTVPQLGDIVHRRVGGNQGVKRIADQCRKATDQGYKPLMFIDEPQYGASDRLIKKGTEVVRRQCVLMQIFERIQHEIGSEIKDHWFVGSSATPFELHDLSKVWEVRQYLTDSYSGYNFFGGRPIDESVTIMPPTSMGLSGFSKFIGLPFLANFSMQVYDGTYKSFNRHAKKIGCKLTKDEYLEEADKNIRETIYRLLKKYAAGKKWPVGICLRAFNNNNRTKELIKRLALDPEKIEVLHYYGSAATGVAVKRAIIRRERPDLPYVIFVTNRARMADAFPVEVCFFMDLAEKTADLNALLQGLLGRACGYNKKSTVVLSDVNKAIIDEYIATDGGLVHNASRHTTIVGGPRRGAVTTILRLKQEMPDPQIRRFFDQIDQVIVKRHIPDGSAIIRDFRQYRKNQVKGFRTGPILQLASELDLFDYIEQQNIRQLLFPHLPPSFKIARATDQIKGPNGSVVKYQIDENVNCRFTFRWYDGDIAIQGGFTTREKSRYMEPTIYVQKLDCKTGKPIDDRLEPNGKRRPGNWRAAMITFPLLESVRELRPGDVAYPNDHCVYQHQMNEEEKNHRDSAVALKKLTRKANKVQDY